MEDVEELTNAIRSVARALRDLGNGNASTQMGAIEAHSVAIKEGLQRLSEAIGHSNNHLDTDELAQAIKAGLEYIGDAMPDIIENPRISEIADKIERSGYAIREGLSLVAGSISELAAVAKGKQ